MLTKKCMVYRQMSQFLPTSKRFFVDSSMILDLSVFIQIKPNFAIFQIFMCFYNKISNKQTRGQNSKSGNSYSHQAWLDYI